MIVSEVAKNKNDEYYTPVYAINPIIPYLPKDGLIWCPFDKENSNYVKRLSEEGFKVEHSHISEGGATSFSLPLQKIQKRLSQTHHTV